MTDLLERFDELSQEYLAWKDRRLKPAQKESARGRVDGYVLRGAEGEIPLSKIMGARSDLLVVHNMGRSCPYCTMWADGFNGLVTHLENRAAFVLVSPDPVEAQQAVRLSRGWKFSMYSSLGTRFKRDLGFEGEDGRQVPGVSAFRRDADGTIRNVANDVFGPGDSYCSAWPLFDLLEGGPGKWQPKLGY